MVLERLILAYVLFLQDYRALFIPSYDSRLVKLLHVENTTSMSNEN